MSDASPGTVTAAFVLSLIAGIWMVAMSVVMVGWAPSWGGLGGMMGGGWMGGHGAMGIGWGWLGIVTGLAVLVGAVGLYARPATAASWGVVILVASALNLLVGMGGFLASILGLIGGVVALGGTSQPST